ncbi:hypothetical protein [Arthrobacter sp. Br18]|uniref:hypothetical protein n=1 Tax=Arthrobacter sp. Br18 TaxID=1312954 RepID=UPI00055BF801|nr:hypothetical protein [Arthrobacter sp. Br18]
MTALKPARASTLTKLALALEDREGMLGTTSDEITMIRRADELTKLSHARLHELVAAARGRGVSWQAIGDALGVSRQAAFKRFSITVENTAGENERTQPTIDLIERTTNVFQSLEAGDFAAVKELMTYTCSRALTKRKVMSLWSEITTTTGHLEACTETTVQTPDGRTTLGKLANRHLLAGAVVQTTLKHEAGWWIGRVAYNGAGKITGILIAPPYSQNLPF